MRWIAAAGRARPFGSEGTRGPGRDPRVRAGVARRSMAAALLAAALVHPSPALAYGSLPAADRMKSCNPRIALAAAKEVLGSPKALEEPLQMFPAAGILFEHGEKDEAVFWFYAAQLRARQQLALQNGDRGQLLTIVLMTLGPMVNNYAFQDVDRLNQTIDRVVLWDGRTPNPFRRRARTPEAEAWIEKVYAGFRDMQARNRTQKDDLQRQARAEAVETDKLAHAMRTPPCRPGEPDPAFDNRTIAAEQKAAARFASTHPQVIREVGAVKDARAGSYRFGRDGRLPIRYDVSVSGFARSLSAIVDVSRSPAGVRFTLACVTPLELGQRDAFKDDCHR